MNKKLFSFIYIIYFYFIKTISSRGSWMVLVMFIFNCLFLTSSLEAQSISGKIVRSDSLTALAYVNIVNKTQSKGTTSNLSGEFLISAKANDTLIFSSIGYKSKLLVLTEKILESELYIKLKPTQYQLSEIDIFGFHHEAFNPKKQKNTTRGLSIPGIPGSRSDFKASKPTISSPITLLYQTFSKREQHIRAGWEFIEKMEYLNKMDSLFQSPEVYQITKLEGVELISFQNYCMNSFGFYISDNRYHMLNMIKQYYAFFIRSRQKK